MEPVNMAIERSQEISADALPFARSYQLEALESGIKQNTIVYLETGSGKTLIAIMLLRSYAHLLRKPSPYIAVFLVPKVVLVSQQAEALKMHTDLKVGTYWGDMGVDFWKDDKWNEEVEKFEVLVMTHQILLNNLRHSFFKLNMIQVLVFDECHHARGLHPYACIMKEFYHPLLSSGETNLPRIFGMTASPINSKGGNSEIEYWNHIHELETVMNSKVYTCASDSVLSEFIPFSTPKFKFYQHKENHFPNIEDILKILIEKHELVLKNLDLDESSTDSISRKLSKVYSALLFCLNELGVWLAMKAAWSFSSNEIECFSSARANLFGEKVVKNFCVDAFKEFSSFLPARPNWSLADDIKRNMDEGMLTSKAVGLVELLLEYRDLEDIRCIVFVERVITAVVIQCLLNELLPKLTNWKTKYIAGSSNNVQSQTRNKQNNIVGEFREGMVNIIVATSILEEGLDVQSCNLVVRFDPCSTVCSFIQSRGRARKQNSDYVLMLQSGDQGTKYRFEKYLASGEIMRKESLLHASDPCVPLESDFPEGGFYRVESTGAIVTLSSSVGLIYFYCSRLPSDGYFKPNPRWDMNSRTLYLPKSCPLRSVTVEGNPKLLKQIACLEACKQLHQIGALTDTLVPDVVVEEDDAQVLANQPYEEMQPSYVPPEMIASNCSIANYHCYIIELHQSFDYEVSVGDVVLCTRSKLENDIENMHFDLQVGKKGIVTVDLKYAGLIELNSEQVMLCKRFQVTLLRLLLDHKLNNLSEILDLLHLSDTPMIDYLLLPATNPSLRPSIIDWDSVTSVLFSNEKFRKNHIKCNSSKVSSCFMRTKNGLVCTCMIMNSLVYTPHNGHVYYITDILNGMNGNSILKLRDNKSTTYKNYYEVRHEINLQFVNQPLLNGRKLFQVKNFLLCREEKEKETSNTTSNSTVELPPELCILIMSPISLSILYSFSFTPSIMHRLESLIIAANLKRMHLDHCTQNVAIPTFKVLEAITSKKCLEKFHLESLEILGDSFLKYAVGQQLFSSYQNNHEGLLSIKKDKIVSNAALCRLGCERKLPGFIRDECFVVKSWIIPGTNSANEALQEDTLINGRKIYIGGRRKMKSKRVADVVEALIGAFLSTGGEISALQFMNWLGIKVDIVFKPFERDLFMQPEKLINVKHLESLLKYTFRDPSLLVEALTHGSYMVPEIPRCYQRLEFLGDAVLDYLITVHLYNKYPGMSPGFLTDMRSASVNNDCYARCAIKAELHKHILYTSHKLHKDISATIINFDKLSSESTFGWDSETSFPKVLGDVIESLAGAIYVDSAFNKEVVFQSIRPLLEPLITPETVKIHPAKELNELCQKLHFEMKKPLKLREKGVTSITIEVVANGVTYKNTSSVSDKRIGKKVACKEVLKSIKEDLNLA
ncbi:endoribonuclease Dicer homolog 2 [Humulus lupulus]|uniref:endoribonuclease Dicer homolog 2 n=1 Tax=Humulus lupulus TaxID=3486 RepID=UPI002B410606|nr:endoribonuclease Dicer homolog 2 [Humulus lupulus]XP_062084110.1 endoribonuclease Dicer homolog 2 [Humulus lupulus]